VRKRALGLIFYLEKSDHSPKGVGAAKESILLRRKARRKKSKRKGNPIVKTRSVSSARLRKGEKRKTIPKHRDTRGRREKRTPKGADPETRKMRRGIWEKQPGSAAIIEGKRSNSLTGWKESYDPNRARNTQKGKGTRGIDVKRMKENPVRRIRPDKSTCLGREGTISRYECRCTDRETQNPTKTPKKKKENPTHQKIASAEGSPSISYPSYCTKIIGGMHA